MFTLGRILNTTDVDNKENLLRKNCLNNKICPLIFVALISIGYGCRTCQLGHWSAWTACSRTCGGGTKDRQRPVCCPRGRSYANCLKERCLYSQEDIWQSTGCNQICQHGNYMNNSCTCSSGWQGSCCREVCLSGYYGNKCLLNCSCVNGECDHVTGKCTCFPGWIGNNCDKTCDEGYFGDQCLDACKCSHGNCDHVTGNCTCLPDWIGEHCNISISNTDREINSFNLSSIYYIIVPVAVCLFSCLVISYILECRVRKKTAYNPNSTSNQSPSDEYDEIVDLHDYLHLDHVALRQQLPKSYYEHIRPSENQTFKMLMKESNVIKNVESHYLSCDDVHNAESRKNSVHGQPLKGGDDNENGYTVIT